MAPAPAFDTELSARVRAEALDRRRLRWSFGLAAGVHVVLLAVTVPRTFSQPVTPAAPPKAVHVLERFRFQEPELPKERIPERRALEPTITVPAPPDVEPRDPISREPDPPLDLPVDADVFVIPSAPPAPEPAADALLRVGGDVLAPRRVSGPDPRYTEIARRACVKGVVILDAVIDREGRVRDIEVLKGLPFGLDREAVRAVSTWRFEPATLDGRPVDVRYVLTVRFDMQGS